LQEFFLGALAPLGTHPALCWKRFFDKSVLGASYFTGSINAIHIAALPTAQDMNTLLMTISAVPQFFLPP
jgi:hypothetical protein